MIVNTQNTTRPVGQFLWQLARSFFNALGEIVQKIDELPLEAKQGVKEGVVHLLSRTGQSRATLELLTGEDEELSRILSACGWWVLQRDINGPVKRALLRLGREGKTAEIDRYLCAMFTENGAARLREKIDTWSKLSYFADREQIVLDALEAHIGGKWTLAIPALLPLVDGLTRRFRKDYLRRSKNSQKVI